MKHLIVLIAVFISSVAFSQTDSSYYVIITHSGVEYIGQIIEKDARDVLIQKKNGEQVYIPTYVIKSIEPLSEDNTRNGEYISSNPQASRYFYTPSALPINRGDGYIQTIYGGVWQFQYGITDRFSIGIGTPLIGAPIWITPKYSFKLGEKTWGALGAQVGSLGWIMGDWSAVFGIGYGVVTFGDDEQNLSIGAGYLGTRIPDKEFIITDTLNYQGYYKNVVNVNSSFAFSLAGMKRVQKNMMIIGEFWALPNVSDGLNLFFGGPGLRLMRQQNLWDFGFWVFNVNDDGEKTTFPVPYISFTWKLL